MFFLPILSLHKKNVGFDKRLSSEVNIKARNEGDGGGIREGVRLLGGRFKGEGFRF